MSKGKGKAKSSTNLVSSANDAAFNKIYSTEAAPASSKLPCAGGMSREPCNVTAIRVSDGIGARTVIADSPASPRLESGYDFLYEVIADYEGSETEKLKPTTVALEVPYAGRCPFKAHPDVRWYPSGSSKKACSDLTMKLVAPPVERNWGKTGWAVFASRGQEFQDYVVVAASCGIGSSSKVNTTLRGLVRVYRTDSWEIELTFPALGSLEAEIESSVQAKATESFAAEETDSAKWTSRRFGTAVAGQESSTSATHGKHRNEQKTTRSEVVAPGVTSRAERSVHSSTRADWNSITDTEQIDLPAGPSVLGFARTYESERYVNLGSGRERSNERRKPEYSFKPSFDFKISRNGRELEVLSILKELLNLALKIKRTTADFIDLIPQAGLKVTFDISLLEGSISGSRERVLGPAKGRIARVEDQTSLTVEVKFFAIKLEVSFGLEVKTGGFLNTLAQTDLLAIEATIKLIIEGSVGVRGTFSRKSDIVKGTGEIKPELKLNGHATIFGYKFGIEGAIEGSITAEATFDMLDSPIRATGKIHRSALTVGISKYSAGNKTTSLLDKTIFEAKQIWQGPIFGA